MGVLCNLREVEKKNSAKISQLEGEAKEKEAESPLPLFALWSDSRLLWQVKLDQLTMATSRLQQSVRRQSCGRKATLSFGVTCDFSSSLRGSWKKLGRCAHVFNLACIFASLRRAALEKALRIRV